MIKHTLVIFFVNSIIVKSQNSTFELINKNEQILAGNRCISISLSDIEGELSAAAEEEDLDSLSLTKNVYSTAFGKFSIIVTGYCYDYSSIFGVILTFDDEMI